MVLVFTKFVIDFKSTQDSGVTFVISGRVGLTFLTVFLQCSDEQILLFLGPGMLDLLASITLLLRLLILYM